MDSAVIGTCRIGYFRIGVFYPIFDELIIELQGYVPGTTQQIQPEEITGVWDVTTWDFCVWAA